MVSAPVDVYAGLDVTVPVGATGIAPVTVTIPQDIYDSWLIGIDPTLLTPVYYPMYTGTVTSIVDASGTERQLSVDFDGTSGMLIDQVTFPPNVDATTAAINVPQTFTVSLSYATGSIYFSYDITVTNLTLQLVAQIPRGFSAFFAPLYASQFGATSRRSRSYVRIIG